MRYILIITLCFFVCCSSKKEFTAKDSNTISSTVFRAELISEISIPLNQKYQYEHSFLQKTEKGNIIGMDVNFNELNVFSFVEEKFIMSIRITNDGPEAIYQPSSFYYHNMDSIFIFSLENQTISIINDKAELINKIIFRDFLLPEMYRSNDVPGSFYLFSASKADYFEFPFSYNSKQQKLYFQLSVDNAIPKFKRLKALYEVPNIAIIDISTDSVSVAYEKIWPSNFVGDKLPNNPYNFVVYNNQTSEFILNYIYSSALFASNRNEMVYSPSIVASDDVTLFDINQFSKYTDEDELNGIIQNEGYFSLVYDPYRDYYYRIFKHPLKTLSDKSKRQHIMQSDFSIVVLDNTLNYIGEVEFTSEKYNFLHIIPMVEGVAISKENPFNKNNKEEYYEFDLLKFSID